MDERKRSLRKEIVRLALPIALQQFMTALVGACDAIMLGKLSQDAMSAVSLATQVTFVFNLFMFAFMAGENMFVAQYYGKGDYTGISQVFSLVTKICGCIAVVFLAGALFFPEQLMRILTNEETLIVLGSEYLRVIGISYVFSGIAQTFLAIMKNCGAVNMSTLINGVMVILNIVLNAVFIFGLSGFPKMGIKGAALATVLATVVQFLWSVGYVLCRIRAVKFSLRSCEKKLFGRFWQKAVPLLINNLAWGIGFSMYSVIMGHLGTDAVAANGIANISKNLVVCFCLGLGNAGSIIVGNRLGADRLQEAKEAGGTLTRTAIIAGVVSGLVLIALSPFITKMVDLTPTARGYLQKMLLICSYYIAGKSVNCMTIGGIFAAGGDSKFGMLCDSVTLWCITVPLGCICAFILKLPVMVVYFVLNLDEIIKLPVVYKHYKKYKWIKNLT
ncbi:MULTISPECIES: MATE family efflux transporter [Blautia]|jgi:putative MATE family efflux protein|uniref:MATE family efflux transporter n=1 Tax=Blautia TaxID=572511 RepID=UPI000E4B43E7|nr:MULTISPECIES: MATE family efflux transporter [Blautia]RHQ38768.1 MATE family efflux transporter [Ruminococcus sp. AF25-28AC]NSF13730.1 MATE family efflux transporter [Blautia wexlerae]NSF27661.1 MATE family efflux transporter [Blautia wexlerae]NSF31406.1 MATE family efflux transporter [Blautia wexlerae]NSF41535.1 MATE family efflux transporter [Blautia wexlerae]